MESGNGGRQARGNKVVLVDLTEKLALECRIKENKGVGTDMEEEGIARTRGQRQRLSRCV